MKKIITFFILLFVGLNTNCYSADPVLCFSDLIDGPKSGWNGSATKGCAVTIWGRNFGSTRGANYVTVCSTALTNASDYAEWGVTADNAVDLERITFWTNSSCVTGTGTIKVTVGGVDTATTTFYARETGSIYFVHKATGDNGYDGTYDEYQSGTTGPFDTLPYARQQLSSGDILYIREGTYDDGDQYGGLIYLATGYNGSANNYTSYIGYPGEIPVLDAHPNAANGIIRNNYSNTGYSVFAKMRMLPTGPVFRMNMSNVGHYRLIGLEMDGQGVNPSWQGQIGCINTDCTSYIDILGCSVHDWGYNKYDHGIYAGTYASTQNIEYYDIGWNEFYNLGDSVSGIYIHPKDGDVTEPRKYADEIDIHDNICYNLEHAGIHIASRVEDIRIYNNIIYACGSDSLRGAIHFNTFDPTVSDVKVYNNTIYSASSRALIIFDNSINAEMKNNIFYTLSDTKYYHEEDNFDGTHTSDFDVWYGTTTTPAWANNPIEADPDFVSPNNDNFHLNAGSPAVDAGTDTVSGVVTLDFDGIARPQDAGFDAGVYEGETSTATENVSPAFQGSFTAF
ncbi:right-handed parallel beta-helix repeat-containing protein [Candidatus Pacearchaeota archaeon]|nr:right-handed parallel beta-helix repeat-containing protein [Candidatus Pacearchaeota archaeon]